MKRVVVSLPEDMLKAPDKMRTGKLVVVSRSEILTSAIKQFLRDEREPRNWKSSVGKAIYGIPKPKRTGHG